jgi:hypothetical protein
VALIELFAWMSEMVLFRLNQVPERLYVHFLNLSALSRSRRRLPMRSAALTSTAADDRITDVWDDLRYDTIRLKPHSLFLSAKHQIVVR